MVSKAFFPVLVCSLLLIVGCGGRVADPIPEYKPGDDDMSCDALKTEMAHIEAQVDALLPQSKKTGKNVALGAAGLFLIFPWFFMDVGDAEKAEIRAYNERYLALEKLFQDKCTSSGQQKEVAPETTAKSRLESLKQLLDDDLITEQEYQERRTKILDEL